MVKRIAVLFLTFAVMTGVVLGVNVFTYSQTVDNAPQQKILYTLPYPGLLPDHPLYIIKTVRDRVLDFTTRDTIKKAELYLVLSDKRAAMSLALADKGKQKMAVTTFEKGEKYFLKIPDLLKISKEQGVSPSSEFITKLKLSNAKHEEVGKTLLKKLNNGETGNINQALLITEQVKKQLNTW